MNHHIDIAGRTVGPGQPCFVIAEAGINHNGDLAMARRLIDVAAEAGDNPAKDSVTARRLGWRTLRVRRPGTLHHAAEPQAGHAAEATLADLTALPALIDRWSAGG